MSYIDDLIDDYSRFVSLPWTNSLAAAQRVWMAVYPPEHERRMRLHLKAFEAATVEAGHGWHLHDITASFEHWMAVHEYRDAYFEDPSLLESAMPAFLDSLEAEVSKFLIANNGVSDVVAIVGAGALFGLGDVVKVSALLDRVADNIAGRMVVFFPGEHEGNSYRLLDARDGWNYLAVPLKPSGSRS